MSRSSHRSPGIVLVAAGACFALIGCSSFTTYKTATPLRKGKTMTVVAPQVNAAGPKETGKAPFPEVAVSVRHGLTDKLEVGGTLSGLPLGQAMSALGFEAQGKRHMWRSSSGRVDVALAGGVGYQVFATSGATFEMIHANLPVIVGINLGRHQLVLAPNLSWQRWYSTGARPVDVGAYGSSLGFRWQVSRRFAILPEFSWARSPTALTKYDNTILLHAGIGLVFGR